MRAVCSGKIVRLIGGATTRIAAGVLLALTMASGLAAQDFRGAIAGRVTDKTGGTMPGVTVTVLNVETNVPSSTVTNEDGNYSVPFLTPGVYQVTTELPGFKKAERKDVEVRIGDRLALDFELEVGGIEETVTVASSIPLLESRTASAGQVIDEKRIALMPLSDGNPFVLARLAPGVAYTGDLKFSRPFDNGGTSAITADGAAGGNEFTLDGSPNMANGRRVAFVPPAGAVAGVQGRDRDLRRAAGPYGGRHRQRHDEERHEPAAGRRLLPLPRREALGERLLPRARRPAEGSARLQALRRSTSAARSGSAAVYKGTNRTFFFSALRVALRQVPGAGPVHGADRGAAQRRLLGAARPGDSHLRPADGGPPRRRPHRAAAVRRQHHSGRAASARSARKYPELLPAAQPGRATRRAATTT